MKKIKSQMHIKGNFYVLVVGVLCLLINITNLHAQVDVQQEKTITGTVSNAETGEPMPGVAVIVKGTGEGTITDLDGNYTIEASAEDILMFRSLGFITEEKPVGEQTQIDVAIQEDIMGLDEVIVTGYGVQKKSDLTGAIASVEGEELSKIPMPSVDQALQGMAAGVYIVPRSGRPGAEADIRIRGVSSINGVSPLVIVDGVRGSLQGLNPNDIESIEVLKDASSSAIYGATGGNGVILITTKKGTEGKIKTNFSAYRGWEESINKIDMMNSQEWVELVEETTDPLLTARPDTFPTYDWQDIIFQQAISEDYNMSISGGNENSTFLFSTNYNKQEGIIQATGFRRLTARLNSEHKLGERIRFDQKTSFINAVTDGFNQDVWHQFYQNPIMPAMIMVPYLPAYDENGDWSDSEYYSGIHGLGENPQVMLDMKDRTFKDNTFSTNLGLQVDLFKGFTISSRFAGDMGFTDEKEYEGIYEASPTDSRSQSRLNGRMYRSFFWTTQHLANYTTVIGNNHEISAMVGMEASSSWGYDINGMRVDMPSDLPELQYFDMSLNEEATSQFVGGTADQPNRQLAYFGRLNYSFAGKYLLTSNFRRDAATNFPPDNRWGNFPSFSVGWKFSDEAFMDNVPVLSFGKIRYGYGETGTNARTGFPYQSSILTPGTFRAFFSQDNSVQGAAPVRIANPELKWETVKMSNAGVDLAFFRNRLTLTVDYFDKTSEDMIMLAEVPYTTGAWSLGSGFDGDETQPEINFGSVKNTGFEFIIGAKKMEGDLRGSINLNLTFSKNEVVSMETDSLQSGSVHNINPITLTRVGSPIASFWGYKTQGLFRESDPTEEVGNRTVITNQPSYVDEDGNTVYAYPVAQPGDVRYADANGDGQINADDKVILGDPHPDLVFGFSLNLEYKGFDLSAFFNGTYGNEIFNGMKQYLYYSQGNGNRAQDFTNRYRNEVVKEDIVVVSENHDTDMPRFDPYNYTRPSDFFVEDGSYLRLRNLTIGYTLPENLVSVANISKLRVYVGARNLFTLTNYTGLNPEVSGDGDIQNMGIDYGVYPITRMYNIGATLSF